MATCLPDSCMAWWRNALERQRCNGSPGRSWWGTCALFQRTTGGEIYRAGCDPDPACRGGCCGGRPVGRLRAVGPRSRINHRSRRPSLVVGAALRHDGASWPHRVESTGIHCRLTHSMASGNLRSHLMPSAHALALIEPREVPGLFFLGGSGRSVMPLGGGGQHVTHRVLGSAGRLCRGGSSRRGACHGG
jgi:hypothetical protein